MKLRNPNIELMDQDILYHLALGSGSHDLQEMFGDVKVFYINFNLAFFNKKFYSLFAWVERQKEWKILLTLSWMKSDINYLQVHNYVTLVNFPTDIRCTR